MRPVRNNENAELLRGIMNGAGFGGIGSEWWHYQDNEIFHHTQMIDDQSHTFDENGYLVE